MGKTILGIMGPGEDAGASDKDIARLLGAEVARHGWILLTGGRNVGVMDAASQGAHEAGGLTIGILPGKDKTGASDHLDIAIPTNLGEARNVLNVQAADAIVAVGMNPGTASEVSLAIKAGKFVILLNCPDSGAAFFTSIGSSLVHIAGSLEEALDLLNNNPRLTNF
jgi:uncharacterized protein (TIGR00725 family)